MSRNHDAIDIDSGVNAGGSDSDDDDDEDNDEDSIEDNEGYSEEHKMFLKLVFDALTDGVNGYHIKDTMKELPYSETAKDLVEWGFLDKFELGNRQAYYWPTDEAGVITDKTLAPRTGGEYGRESPKHRVGVLLIKAYYDELGYETHMYYSPDEQEKKFDLVAEPTAESPDDRRKIVEVELTPEHKRHVVDDSIKLAGEYGDAIWVVENNEAMRQLLGSLTDQIGYIEATSQQSFEKTNSKLDADGIQKVFGINKLRDELNGN